MTITTESRQKTLPRGFKDAMSHWNYRVIEFTHPSTSETWRAIHEVHYDEKGLPYAYSDPPGVVMGDTNEEMLTVLDRMRDCLDKPALVEADFKGEME